MNTESKIEKIVDVFSSVEGFEKVQVIDTWPSENYYRIRFKVKVLKYDYIQSYLGAPNNIQPTKLSFTKVKFEKQVEKILSKFNESIRDYSFLSWPERKSGYANRSYGEKTPSYFDQDTYEIELYLSA